MEFQLPSVLQEKLTPYDQVHREKAAEKRKAANRAAKPFHLGLPPVDQLIPNDVLPINCDRERIIKDISGQDIDYRFMQTCYPRADLLKPNEPITHSNGKPLVFKDTDKVVHNDHNQRVQRRIMIFHFEGMWTCIWIPHTHKYLYGYSFAFKETKANKSRFECEMYDDGDNRKVFCVPRHSYHSRKAIYDKLGDNVFKGYSWNDCKRVRVNKSWWRYKTVYVTKELVGQGHDYDITSGVFNGRPIESWHDKSRILKGRLKDWKDCLASTIPHWEDPDVRRYGRHSSSSHYLDMFNRILPEQNSFGYVMKMNYEEKQRNWHESDNKYLQLSTLKTWEVEDLKALLFRLTNKNPLDLNERRHNISSPLWKENGWIEQPYFRKMLHHALEVSKNRMEASESSSTHWVTAPIEHVLHVIKWITYVLEIWPDTPVDYFQQYEKDFLKLNVPSSMSEYGYYRHSFDHEEMRELNRKKIEYFSRMPVKTFLESVRKYGEQRVKEDTDRGYYDFETRMDRKVYGFREWNDTVNMLDSVIRSQILIIQRWDKLEPKPKLRELDAPRRWRLTELHDHVMAMQWKENNENFNLPQDLFAKPIKVTWKEAFADDPIYQSTRGLENVSTGKTMWSEKEDSVMTFFQPITSHQLADWGRAVRNCVGNSSYATSIKHKRYFIVLAMVDQKPRFTIQLKLSNGTLLVDQIADIANKRLNDEERQFVEHGIGRALQLITTQLQPEEQNS